MRRNHFRIHGRLLAAIFFLFASSAFAQSGSTDVMPEGRAYLTVGLSTHMEPHVEGGYQTYSTGFVYGVRRNVEAGVNFEAAHPLVPEQGFEFQPHVKWQFHSNETRGTAASVGAVLFAPSVRRTGTDTFGMIHGAFSKQFAGRFGPRLTSGAYVLLGSAPGGGSRAGMTVGFEQPLHRKVSFAADWIGGNNRFGFGVPSFTFSLPRGSQLTVGYGFGNQGRKNNELVVSYGMNL